MAKKIRRMLSLIVALCLCVSVLPMQALAEAVTETQTETETSPEGLNTDVTTTTTTETDEAGNTTITVTIEKDTAGTTEDGVDVKREETETTTSVTKEGGNVTEQAVKESSESKEWTEDDGAVKREETQTTTSVTKENGEVIEQSGKESSETTTTVTEENGEVTEQSVKEDSESKEWTEDGVAIKREETTTTTTVTEANGAVTEQTVTDGSETKEWTEDVKPGDEVPEVEVKLDLTQDPTEPETNPEAPEADPENPEDPEPTEPKTAVGQASKTYTEGEIDSEEGKTSTTVNRVVELEVKDVTVTVEKEETNLVSIKPDRYEEKDSDNNDTTNGFSSNSGLKWKGGDKKNGQPVDRKAESVANTKPKPEEEGYDYQMIGIEETTDGRYRVDSWKVTYQMEDGKIVLDENGNPVVKEYAAGKKTQGNMQILRKKNEVTGEEELVYTYCLDKGVDTIDGAWYMVTNLEDSDYYATEDAENHIRGIVTNGYWGTESGIGSVDYMIEQMRATLNGDEEIVVNYKGKDEPFKIYDILANLKEGEALSATQAAIWSYSNGRYAAHSGENVHIVDDTFSNIEIYNAGAESLARVRAVYNWLLELEEEKSDVVINKDNFVDEISLSVGEKATDFEENLDDNEDNDVYNTELKFSLAFIPDPKSDDLLVFLTDADGATIKDKDGKPIIRRLAGENSEGRTAETITADDNGVYTLTGLQIGENSDFVFDLRLEGTQVLKNGVYVYTPHGGRGASQTMVGMAKGTQEVDISAGMTLSFDVDENKNIVVEREWHNESDPKYTPGEEPEPTEPEPTEPEPTEPEPTEPEPTEPEPTEPEPTEPEPTEPEPTEPEPTEPEPTEPEPTEPEPTEPEPTEPEPTEPEPTEPEPTEPEPTEPEPTEPELTEPEPTEPEPTVPEEPEDPAEPDYTVSIPDTRVPYSPGPIEHRMVNGEAAVIIEDEEVPLAATPETGDMTALWIGFIVVAAVGLCAYNVYYKKHQQNVF